MRWAWKIGKLAGIDVYVHATFLLLVGFIVVASWTEGHDVARTISGLLFVMAIFGCIVLHELGHALTARRFGIRTRDIVLLPIGGVARLERMPEEPNQELFVALAGPAVNVVIATSIFVLLGALGRLPTLREAETVRWTGQNFVPSLMSVNVWLVLFNLIPAFPMDGGRVLRALLARRMSARPLRCSSAFSASFWTLSSSSLRYSSGWGRAAKQGWFKCAPRSAASPCNV